MTATLGPYQHIYTPPTGGERRTLLLLHGTGGNERDLLPLGRMLVPAAGILSPLGNVLENGAPRFFRRLAEGVFDLPDLHQRTDDLARFVKEAAARYQFDPALVTAVGFSNGANIAASLLLSHPGVLAGAVLFRAMVPFEPASPVDLAGTAVFIGAGRADPLVSPAGTERLAELLREAGAMVKLEWQPGGHKLTQADVAAAQLWLQSQRPA